MAGYVSGRREQRGMIWSRKMRRNGREVVVEVGEMGVWG